MSNLNKINQGSPKLPSPIEHHDPSLAMQRDGACIEEEYLNDINSDVLELDLNQCRLKNMSALGLNRFHKLEQLILRQNLFQEIAGMDELKPNLKELDLYDNSIVHIEPLAGFSHLEILDLSFNRIKTIPPNVLADMKSLTHLYLASNKISKIENLKGLHNLTNLELGANRIREIENIHHLTSLTELWLATNKITELKGLSDLPNLRLLSIQSNRITQISGLPSTLEELYLSHNGIQTLRGVETLPRLRFLDVCNNQIEILDAVSGLSEMEELWISNNKLSDWQALETQLVPLQHLHTLYLEGNPIQKEAGTRYRRNIKDLLPQLSQLDATYFR